MIRDDDLKSKFDYSEGQKEAAHRVLVELVNIFGEYVTTLAYDMTSFRLQAEVSASPTFFGWVFGFGGKVQILGPESVKEQYRQMIDTAYQDS